MARSVNRFLLAGEGPGLTWRVDEMEMRKQIADHKWPFYVYALCSKEGAGFYIGKGQGDRIFDHVREACDGAMSNKCIVIRALGDELRYAILYSCADEQYAFG